MKAFYPRNTRVVYRHFGGRAGRVISVKPNPRPSHLRYTVEFDDHRIEEVDQDYLFRENPQPVLYLPLPDGRFISTDAQCITDNIPTGGIPYNGTAHTPECIARWTEWLLKAHEYVMKWPEMCPACNGEGYFYTPSTYEDPDNYDPCYLCSERGFCPRCGDYTDMNDGDWWQSEPDGVCPKCGYQIGKDGGYDLEWDCNCLYRLSPPTSYGRQGEKSHSVRFTSHGVLRLRYSMAGRE